MHFHQDPVECQSCGKRFEDLAKYVTHETTCRKGNKTTASHVCQVCAKRFSYLRSLKIHIRDIHCNEDHVVCDTCGSKFKAKRYLLDHIKYVHKKEENLKKCPFCKFQTSTGFTLTAHIKTIHEGIREFVCHICNKACSQKGNLESHIRRMHSGVTRKKPNKVMKKSSPTTSSSRLNPIELSQGIAILLPQTSQQ